MTVTCIENTRKTDIGALNKSLRERGMLISNGYGSLKDKTFRIGHMGDLTLEDMEALTEAMEEILGLN